MTNDRYGELAKGGRKEWEDFEVGDVVRLRESDGTLVNDFPLFGRIVEIKDDDKGTIVIDYP